MFFGEAASPAEQTFLTQLVLVGLDFVKIEGTPDCLQILQENFGASAYESDMVLDDTDSSNEEEESKQKENLFDDSRIYFNPLRPGYLQLFNPNFQRHYVRCLELVYQKISHVLDECSQIELLPDDPRWKNLEACLWTLSTTAQLYLSLPSIDLQIFMMFSHKICHFVQRKSFVIQIFS